MKILFAKPYQEVKDLCHTVKADASSEAAVAFVKEVVEALPGKCVLVPVPSSGGTATYTKEMATEIAVTCNEVFPHKTAVVFDCLAGAVRDSVCGRKQQGLPFYDIDFGFFLKDGFQKERLRMFVDEGWTVALVDNVIDTGTTARAAIETLELDYESVQEKEAQVIAIGDTGAWKNF